MSPYLFLFDKKSEAKNNYVSALYILPTVFLTLQSKPKQNHPLWCVNGFKTRDTLMSYSCLWKVPTVNVVEKLQLWSSSSPSGTSKALNLKSFRTCLHTVGRCWELPRNKHQTTSSKSSAQWPTAWSEEACSPCWAPSHDLGVRPTLLDTVLAKHHQSGKVLSRANVSQTLKTKGRFRFAKKQPV